MRVGPKLIVLALFVVVFVGACANGCSNEPVDAPNEVAGPALVMFYTDN